MAGLLSFMRRVACKAPFDPRKHPSQWKQALELHLAGIPVELQTSLQLLPQYADVWVCQTGTHAHLEGLQEQLDALIMLHHQIAPACGTAWMTFIHWLLPAQDQDLLSSNLHITIYIVGKIQGQEQHCKYMREDVRNIHNDIWPFGNWHCAQTAVESFLTADAQRDLRNV